MANALTETTEMWKSQRRKCSIPKAKKFTGKFEDHLCEREANFAAAEILHTCICICIRDTLKKSCFNLDLIKSNKRSYRNFYKVL